jgi:hypothetical protein
VSKRDAVLDDVLHIEVIALMVERIIERPICRYPEHIPWVWWNDSGRAICGVCHPKIGREHAV